MEKREKLGGEIQFLGRMLGEIIREQAGPERYELEEAVRLGARARREGQPGAEDALLARITAMGDADARTVVRAFTLFFDLMNLAEDRERVRVLRERERARYPEPRSESMAEAALLMRGAGLDAGKTQALSPVDNRRGGRGYADHGLNSGPSRLPSRGRFVLRGGRWYIGSKQKTRNRYGNGFYFFNLSRDQPSRANQQAAGSRAGCGSVRLTGKRCPKDRRRVQRRLTGISGRGRGHARSRNRGNSSECDPRFQRGRNHAPERCRADFPGLFRGGAHPW